MNLGKGFLIPQENGVIHNGDPWIPVTPEKPVTRKNGSIQNGEPWIPVTPENPVMRNDGVIYNGDPWIPVTPENPVTRTSNPVGGEMQRSLAKSSNWHKQIDLMGRISAETPVIQNTFSAVAEVQGDQMGRTNWTELVGLYQGVLQKAPTNEALHVSDPDALSVHCEHNKRDGAAAWANGCFNLNVMKDVNGTPSRSIHATDKLPLTSSHPTAGNEQANYQFANSVVLQQQQALSSNQEIINSNQQKLPSDGISFKYKPVNNLNSPPRVESTIISCAANCLQFEPAVTPGQGMQVKNHQIFDIQNFSTDESLRHEKNNQELISTNSQVENPFEELLDNVIVAPTASNATSPKGSNISEDRDCKGIDLNKTPQQRTPKRKKHRPKVVVEGKPKRNPKPPASKDKILNENPTGKRKYVRKKGLEASISRPGNESFGVETSCPSPAAKSCRRALNFDLESRIDNTSEDKMVDDQIKTNLKSNPFDLNLKSPETVQDAICPMGSGIVSDKSATMKGEQSGCSAEIQQGASISIVICDNNQKLAEKSSPPVPTASIIAVRDHNLDVIARSQNLQTAISCQNNDQSWSSQGYQLLNGEGIGQMLLQANTNLTKLDVAQQTMLRSSTTFLKEIAEGKEKRGSKRDHWHASQMLNPKSVDLMHSQLSHHDISRTAKQMNISGKTGIATLEANKRRKFKATCQGFVSSEPSYVASIQYSSREVESKSRSSIHESRSSSCTYGRLPNFNLGMESNFGKQTSAGNEILADQGTSTTTVGNGFEDQRASSTHVRLLMARKGLHHNAAADSFTVTAGTTDCLVVSPNQRVPATTLVNETTTSPVDLSVKRQTLVPASSSQAFSMEKLHPKKNKKKLGCQNSSVKAKERKNWQNCAVIIDEIVYRLEHLKISRSGKKLVAKDQNAIVPYKADDKVVPYEGFDPIKRRKPRPKVDLDQETNRLWNLLMGKAGSENTGTTDNEKEKWWEGERKVVRGRIDSFIARMHLVQGDRRFSQWKGSVVDSVIGVFLTQNVSDHLSSSAFMSLASKFPVQLTNSEATSCKYGPMLWIEEPDVQIIDPDGTITYHGINIRQPLYKQTSMTLSESSERRSDHLNSETGVHYANENSSGTEEEVVSSQNSSDSFPQSAKYTRSSSDSEVEDHIMVCNSLKTCISESTPKTKRSAMIQQYQCQVLPGMLLDKNPMPSFQQQENSACIRITPRLNSGSNQRAYPLNSDVLCLQGTLSPSGGSCLDKASDIRSSEHGSLSSFFSTFTETTEIGGVTHSRKEMGGIARSASCSTARKTGIPINHATRIDQCSDQHRKVELQSGFLSSQESANSNQVQMSQSFLLEEKSGIEPKRLDVVDAKGQTAHIFFPSEQLSKADTNIPNTRKRKPKVDKAKAVDWDSLRKKVLSKVGKREKCANNMDSLDYDTLRRADMKTVSDAIHERGMNNMLAERIQDFLNRLVRDHGSTDLEWLRDVEPAEAKEYLLSVRGLGLKSVECVRLLTLHQVAFPVDTNVGRIAVRLGWVPLQPLPESLQLHLLELYPVLESIQKYLWPRLCKLDQKTLYELHYQLITFGKVFCTKRKPNCNACPMRAECRHFASAFASARLALPGPEERSVVNLTTPMAANEIPPIPANPIPLPPAKADVDCEVYCSGSKCEPIIEEPATPEPSPEAPESDIEDLFYEDPDEIPMINFSMEELKMNVQSVLQEQNMDFQAEDLSRALVALDPSTASIPVPKLKNVSRLRTEHQVYELPDSHALLKGMESREPDDPSPYLLAIWGPGETADSSQPPEGCSSSPCVIVENSQTVKGTLLIPCRTAMRGSFPLNGTYFQVNEMFADHESSKNPIDVPRDWLWQLPRRTVYFGTSVTSIFRGLPTEGIQYCFWRGFVCVRGFDREQRAPRPLHRRLHEPASKMVKNKNNDEQKKDNAKETNRVN